MDTAGSNLDRTSSNLDKISRDVVATAFLALLTAECAGPSVFLSMIGVLLYQVPACPSLLSVLFFIRFLGVLLFDRRSSLSASSLSFIIITLNIQRSMSLSAQSQGYLAHKKQPPPP